MNQRTQHPPKKPRCIQNCQLIFTPSGKGILVYPDRPDWDAEMREMVPKAFYDVDTAAWVIPSGNDTQRIICWSLARNFEIDGTNLETQGYSYVTETEEVA